jgi:hypothetical protein
MTAKLKTAVTAERIGLVLRRLVLGAFLLGIAGAAAELVLIRHTDGVWQWIPLALIGLSVVALVVLWALPGRFSLWVFRGSVLLMLLSGAIGLYLHFQANLEWVEDPSLSGWPLLWQALIRGKNPPVLAPGAMIQFAVLGWAYTYRYPASGAARAEQVTT